LSESAAYITFLKHSLLGELFLYECYDLFNLRDSIFILRNVYIFVTIKIDIYFFLLKILSRCNSVII